ncbi:thioredoxin domain-containing protein [Candidatus Woesearchaeota archaeon]|nr:thioredoxin domain-containing protein [Candidatus Woesearchaeota archaeon]
MMDFTKNTLATSSSPYLQQHKDNPIYWQEWSLEVLEHAQKQNKLLFVSVGYATCHWCHVMASEAFSNPEIAQFLNEHFVAIKVDREQRLDIDQYMMAFLIEQQGHGGWPLNVILTPDQIPMLAMTYVPVTPKYGMPGFFQILEHAVSLYEKNPTSLEQFVPEYFSESTITSVAQVEVIETMLRSFDSHTASFHHGPQFPPHNTLLFLLAYYEETKEDAVKNVIEKILDTLATRGLHDHLQGGFYRYCVDQQWTIPHFEKMLYDQALLLWVFSVAYKILKKDAYKEVAEKIISCLEETFEEDGLYYSGHDADTDHEEGTTYLWTKEELEKFLSPAEYTAFASLYILDENFEGNIHLLKKKLETVPTLEKKLLLRRKKRKQPFVDKKIITSWNSLLGIAFVMAERCGCSSEGYKKAEMLFDTLLKKHYEHKDSSKKLAHSSLGNSVQSQEFLEDYAALLLFATYFYEIKHDEEVKKIIHELFLRLESFYDSDKKQWIESRNADFITIPAQTYDHPTPSSVAVAEFTLFRSRIILGMEHSSVGYGSAFSRDFHNLFAFYSEGYFHILHVPSSLDLRLLPVNAFVLKGNAFEDCYKGMCQRFKDEKALLAFCRK